ncbi:MAG TPA: hypothetical protein VN428_03775 [Bryobacteraceae bacterium]|nr:hypothetical protein [Bryobacteraceae bacterium]
MRTIVFAGVALFGLCFVATAQTAGRRPVPPQLKEVIVVHKTHFDIGCTDLAREVLERYRTSMIDKALETIDNSNELPPEHRFAWTIPGWPMAQILWEGQTPERRRRVLEAFRSGGFVTHALPFTTHTESLGLETLVRGLGFSSRLARSAGLPLARDAKMTDVPSHSWGIVPILKHGGVDFLHLGCNHMSSNPDIPHFAALPDHPEWKGYSLFWWEGPDGSRLLTMYSRDYGSSLAPPPDWPYRTWLALIHTGDNIGPPAPEAVRKLMSDAKEQLPGVQVRLGRLSDFADAIVKENPKLPVVRGDMPDTWIYGIGSLPAETALSRVTQPRIGALEALGTLNHFWAGAPQPSNVVAEAYEQALLYGEHTWGYDAKRFPRTYGAAWREDRAAGKFARLEESWAEHTAYARRSHDLTATGLNASLTALSRAARVRGRKVAVFNALPWTRDGVVEVAHSGAAVLSLRDASTGDVVPAEATPEGFRFRARSVPSLGYRTYSVIEESGQAGTATQAAADTAPVLENAYFRLKLDPARGPISSLLDKKSGLELVDGDAASGFGQSLYERFSIDEMTAWVQAYTKPVSKAIWGDFGKPNMPSATAAPYELRPTADMQLTVSRGPVADVATMASSPGSPEGQVRLQFTLYHGLPFVDVAWTVKGKLPEPMPEAGWLTFPFKVENARFLLSRPGGTIDPASDVVRATNHDIYCLDGGMAVLNPAGGGVGICPLDSPLVSLDRPRLWKYSKEFSATKPHVFVNLYNNLWGVNFAQWVSGSWTSRARIWAINNYDSASGLVVPAQEARMPLLGALADGAPGKLKPARTGLSLSRSGVLVTAFGANPDGDGTVLRLWEQSGQDGACRVCLPPEIKPGSVQPVDLRGRPAGQPLRRKNGCFDVQLKKNAPMSFVLTGQRRGNGTYKGKAA